MMNLLVISSIRPIWGELFIIYIHASHDKLLIAISQDFITSLAY